MRWPLAIVLLTGLAGCRTSPRKDLVEAELRVKDQDLRELRDELERTGAYNQYLQRELRNIQQAYPSSAPPEALTAAQVRSLALGRQTSGIDDDNIPGDEALQVVLEPRDGDNHTVKVAGTATIQALEITTEGLKRPISAWHIDPETLRKSWRTGLLSTGYYLVLPWQGCPSSTKLRVVAQFVTQDNRMFEAEKDVVVRLIPVGLRKTLPATEAFPPSLAPAQPMLPAPAEGPTLPAPRESEPSKPPMMEKVEKKEEPPSPLGLPPLPPTPGVEPISAADPQRPLKGAVELLKPIVPSE